MFEMAGTLEGGVGDVGLSGGVPDVPHASRARTARPATTKEIERSMPGPLQRRDHPDGTHLYSFLQGIRRRSYVLVVSRHLTRRIRGFRVKACEGSPPWSQGSFLPCAWDPRSRAR